MCIVRLVWTADARPTPNTIWSILHIQEETMEEFLDAIEDDEMMRAKILHTRRIGHKVFEITGRRQVAFTKAGVAQVVEIIDHRYTEPGEVA